MTWHVTESIDLYAEHVWDLLAARADLNTIALTQITGTRGGTSWSGEEPTFAWWSRAGSTSGAVSLTPPYEMLLNVVPDGTMDELVLALRRRATPVPGVNGTPGTATRFAELWTAGTTQQTVLARQLRLYATMDPVVPEPAPAGHARHARADEVDLIVGWYEAFGREVGDQPVDNRPSVERTRRRRPRLDLGGRSRHGHVARGAPRARRGGLPNWSGLHTSRVPPARLRLSGHRRLHPRTRSTPTRHRLSFSPISPI